VLARRLLRARLAVAVERLPLALDARQLGLAGGKRGGRLVARSRRALPCAPGRVERLARPAERDRGLLRPRPARLPRSARRPGRAALRAGRRAGALRREPLEPRLGLRDFGLGDAPLGLDPGMVGGRLGQRQFGGAAGALGVFGRALELRSPPFVLRQRRLAGGKVLRQLLQRVGRVGCQRSASPRSSSRRCFCRSRSARRCSAASSWLDSAGHAVPCALASSRRSASSSRTSASFSAAACCAFCAPCAAVCAARRARSRLAPAPARRRRPRRRRASGEHQPRLGVLDLLGQRLVALGLLGLATQRRDLAVEPGHQVLEPARLASVC
jgi:hypothetical protein